MSSLDKPERMDSFFNMRAPGYEDHMKESDTYYVEKELLAAQFDTTDEKVDILDLGCGTGLEIEYILQRVPGARFVCLDIAREMLEILKSRYNEVLNQIEIVEASYFDYDFDRNRFEYVVASATMHHWLPEQKRPLYRRIFDSLKQGGKFVNDDYLVPEDQEKEALAKCMRMKDSGLMKDGEFYHVDIPFSVETESKILYDAGFQRVEVIYEHYGENHCDALLVGVKEK